MLDLIVNNPFRVLGVYSNAKQADIVRNFGKMKAYLNVGRDLAFNTDLDFLLGPIERTLTSIQKAQSDIILPQDKIRYALFWFCDGNSLDEVALSNLANQDIEKALVILGKRISYSSLVNMAIIAILQERYIDAVKLYSQLIHDSENRNKFIKDICGDTFQISENELIHIVIDELLIVTKPLVLLEALTVQTDISYASEKALSGPLAKINSEIARAKAISGSDAAASLKAGRALIRNTKTALNTVKSLVGSSGTQYQSVADNLAKQILQCGINYYNNTDDNDDIDNALELQQYALDIAIGKLVKGRCKQNVDILIQKKEQKAYENDLATIAAELKAFQSAAPSISKAESLVRKCKPHLAVIKTNLGANNDLYLKISSAVANNALGMLINIVNSAQNSSLISYNIMSGTLKNTIDSALNAMTVIGSLDMTGQERIHFTQNRTKLVNLKTQLLAVSNSTSVSDYSSSGGHLVSTSSSSSNSSDTNWGCIVVVIIAVIFVLIGIFG